MDNRPHGRDKKVSGQGKGVFRRGSAQGGGPVGKADGYSGRKPQSGSSGSIFGSGSGNTSSNGLNSSGTNGSSFNSSGTGGGLFGTSGGQTRQGCGLGTIIVVVLLALLLFGGGKGISGLFSSLLGGSNSSSNPIGSLMGGGTDITSLFAGNGSTSQGWVKAANTGKLDTSVAPTARAKRTQILGGGRDVVTIMVYLCGTDLESKSGMATADLQEMSKATIGSNVNLIVFTGGCSRWKNNVVSSSVNQIYKVENGQVRCLQQNAGNASMVKPETLASFIRFCGKNFPANRYGLIMWDHGGGSISGYGYDEKNKMAGSMTLTGIKEALAGGGVTFDFVGFDACLMATLENALMLDDYADYLIASEETEPGVGWYYTDWLTKLSQNTSIPTTEIGKNIIDDFVAACAKQCPGQKTTLSLIDLAELSATVPENLKSFSASTTELMKNNGFKKVSDARNKTREFAPSTKIDQIDLANLAYNIGTKESNALADSLLGAVKYNKTSSNITNAYGLSIYFPYKKTSKVNSAVQTYNAIGMDSSYADCIQRFASLETSGQAASGTPANPLSTLLGEGSGGGMSSLGDITDLLGGLLGGDFSGLSGITESGGSGLGNLADLASNFGFLGNNIDVQNDANYISQNQFDSSALKWTKENGQTVLKLSEDQWKLVHDLELNVFYDDGEGYIDLGLDNVFDFTKDGALLGDYDGTWLAIDGQVVPYYYIDSVYDGDSYTITGRVPVMLNGTRTNLLIVFDNAHPDGFIAGATTDYAGGETETVAKSMVSLTPGDRIDFMCDYYKYDGTYQSSYLFGNEFTYTGNHSISNVYLPDKSRTKATYMLTDIYNKEYWTEVLPNA